MIGEAHPSDGRLFPVFSAVVQKQADRYLLVNSWGRRSVIEGPICHEIARSLEQSAPTAELSRLAPAHPALAELAAWLATPAVPLTQLDAVRLDGFDTLFLELTGRCNERCVHCYADAAPTVTEALSREDVLRVIEEASQLGFRRIQLTGGDPLLCDFLPEAVAHARTHGIPHIEIYTNGLALTAELLAELAPHQPTFAFSVYSIDPDEHDRVTRTPGSHKRTFAAIDRVVASKLKLRAALIIVDQESDPQALIDLLRARGVRAVSWTRTFSVGRGADVAEASRARTLDIDTSVEGGHRAAITTGERERQGKLCVTYTGDIVPCIFQRSAVIGNVRDGLLQQLVAGTSRAGRRAPGLSIATEVAQRLQCPSCRLTEVALGLAARSA